MMNLHEGYVVDVDSSKGATGMVWITENGVTAEVEGRFNFFMLAEHVARITSGLPDYEEDEPPLSQVELAWHEYQSYREIGFSDSQAFQLMIRDTKPKQQGEI